MDVELEVTVPVRLGVRLPEEVTVGVPVLISEFVAEPEGVPEIVTDLEPVCDTLFVCVEVRVTVELCVVDRVAVPEGNTVPEGVTACVASLDPEEETVELRLAVEDCVTVLDPVLEGVFVGVARPEPETLDVPDPDPVLVSEGVIV